MLPTFATHSIAIINDHARLYMRIIHGDFRCFPRDKFIRTHLTVIYQANNMPSKSTVPLSSEERCGPVSPEPSRISAGRTVSSPFLQVSVDGLFTTTLGAPDGLTNRDTCFACEDDDVKAVEYDTVSVLSFGFAFGLHLTSPRLNPTLRIHITLPGTTHSGPKYSSMINGHVQCGWISKWGVFSGVAAWSDSDGLLVSAICSSFACIDDVGFFFGGVGFISVLYIWVCDSDDIPPCLLTFTRHCVVPVTDTGSAFHIVQHTRFLMRCCLRCIRQCLVLVSHRLDRSFSYGDNRALISVAVVRPWEDVRTVQSRRVERIRW